MIERLYIGGIYVPTLGLNPSITKSLLDITEPDKRKSTYTKTITLPRSKELDKVMTHYFEVNLTTGSFNPNNKVDVKYQVDSTVIIDGFMRLNNVNITDRNNITYEITMSADNARFFANIKGHDLTELDLSEFDHSFTKEIQALSWETEIIQNSVLVPFAYGKGYVYPLIDFGYSANLNDFIFNQIGCCVYEHEYMKRIIEFAGFTYTSTFLDSAFFKRLIIPSSPEAFTLTSDEIEDREFSANTPQLTSTGTTTSNNLPDNALSANDIIKFTNEISDPGLNYDPATGVFTCVNAGVYNFMGLIDINATFTPATGAAVKLVGEVDGYLMLRYTPNAGTEIQVQAVPFYITADEGAGYTVGARSTSATPTYPDPDYIANKVWTLFPLPIGTNVPREVNPPDKYYIELNGIAMNAGDKMNISWKAGFYSRGANAKFIDSLANIYDGDATITISLGAFYNKVANTTIAEGNTLYMDKVIPKVKMLDYFMSNVKRFNLIVDIDPTNPTNLIIEPRDDYYGTTVMNISELIDDSKPITQVPMNVLNVKRYRLTYKEDGDYWNQQYKTSWQSIYGEREVEVDTDLTSNEQVTELIFSPTVMVAPPGSDRVLPTIKQYNENNEPIATKHNIRSLYYGGMKPCLKAWKHINYIAGYPYLPLETVYFEYPYAGHWDDPFNPTLDINFGLTEELYYDDNITAITATDNNLTNKYHGKALRENTDPRSRFVEAYVHLTTKNYNLFTFDKLYFFKRAFHRLHKVDGYNPTSPDTTKCEFLLIQKASAFTPSTRPVNGAPISGPPSQAGGAVDMDETTPVKGDRSSNQQDGNNYTTESAKVFGSFNYIASDSTNIEINGNKNMVQSDCDNVMIQGDNNFINAGVKNVTLINTSGVTVNDSNLTYINGKIKDYWLTKSADFVVDDTVYGYYLDGSSATIQAELRNSESEFFFKCVDGTNRVYIDATPYTIDSTSATFDLLENESIRLKWNPELSTYNIIN